MRKLLLGVSLALASVASYAQDNPIWNLVSIAAPTGENVGYIYQSYAVGTLYSTPPEKDAVALRLICSTKGHSTPIIAIYWDGAHSSSSYQHLNIQVDRKNFDQEWNWVEESGLTYRPLSDSKELIDLMKKGHAVSFDWFDSNTRRRRTIISLIGFNAFLNDFSTACKL